jgi:outer membrane protein
MKRIKFFAAFYFLFISFSVDAQTLTFDEAVRQMLSNNFDIQIVTNDNRIASELNNIGNAGFLPSLDINANFNRNITNAKQEYFDGTDRDAVNAVNSGVTASALLSWTLFDGFRMFAQKNILNSNERISEYNLRAVAEQGIIALAQVYYSIAVQEELLNAMRQSLDVSRERYSLANRRLDIGSGSRQEVIQALIDMNSDSATVLTQITSIQNLKTELNLILNRNIIDAVEVENNIPLDTTLVMANILSGSADENISLLRAREHVRVSQFQINNARSGFYPRVGVYAGYDFGRSTNETGLLRSNQMYGPTMGVFLQWNLFNGLRDYTNLQVQKIELETSGISEEKAGNENTARIIQAYRNYELAQNVLALQRINLENAGDNLDIALRKFELAAISSVEFRDIQLQQLQAQNRLLDAMYNIRIYELELKQLAGTLSL